MKKLIVWLFCLVLLLSATACGEETSTPADDTNPSVSDEAGSDATTPTEGEADGTEAGSDATTGEKDATTATTKNPTTTDRPGASDNVVEWTDLFGDETTTTTKKGDTTGKPTSTTKKPTTTTTTTTVVQPKPTVVDKVELPAVGYDVDGRGRIKVSAVSLNKGVMSLSLRNYTDEQKSKWITEETNYVTYACYDSNGNELKGKNQNFGYLYIGCLEAGDVIDFDVTLPTGTTKVVITGAKIVYWTPWG